MPTLSPGVAQINLTAGQVLQFDAGGAGIAFVYAAPRGGHGRPLGERQVLIGPFARDSVVDVNVDRALTYTLGKSIAGMRDLYTDGASLYDSNGMPLAAINALVSGASNVPASICREDQAQGGIIMATLGYQARISHLTMPFDPNRFVSFSSGKAWFGDFYKTASGDVLLTGRIKIRAGIEYPAGVFTPLFAADGSRDIILTPSAPISYLAWTGVPVTPGATKAKLHVRAEQLDTLSTTNTLPIKYFRNAPTGLQTVNYDDTAPDMGDYTLNASQPNTGSGTQLPSNSLGGAMGPYAITTSAASNPRDMIGIIGDSIYDSGPQVYKLNRGCSASYGARLAGLTVLEYGFPAARLYSSLASGGIQQRINLAAAAGCTRFVLGFLTNDNIDSRTLVQMQGDVTSAVALIVAAGMRPIVPTTPPKTSSSDNFATTTNQTAAAGNFTGGTSSIWAQMNDWIRSQAALGYWTLAEFADALTPDRNVCLWKAANRTVTDGAITSATSNLSSATANWTNADVGRMVQIPGAGAAGALLTAVIKSITSSTVAVIAGQDGAALTASTTVSAQTLVIGPMTWEGTHPSDNALKEYGGPAFQAAFVAV